jgi:hypothetical protein
MYCTASPSSAFTSTAGNISLAASVEGLQDDVLIMSRKAADIMVLLEQIKLTISGNPRFKPLYQWVACWCVLFGDLITAAANGSTFVPAQKIEV